MPERTIVVWCPDWPVTAAGKAAGCRPDAPIAVLEGGRVWACSYAAREDGVRRGLKTRDAQARCPDLVTLPYDPVLDARAFEPVVTAVEALTPGVEVVQPGLCALKARGPSRYYGGEAAAAAALIEHLETLGVLDCRVGIADGLFAAEQAARVWPKQSGSRIHAVPVGGSANFLAPLPIDVLERPELADLLRRLGLRTLGAFAELSGTDVLTRLGTDGARAHRLARGADDRPVVARRPPPNHTREVDFEPSADRVDQVAFAVRGPADGFVADLAEQGLVCVAVRVEVSAESGEVRCRTWSHPRWFDAADVVDRVRWQLQGIGGNDGGLASAVVRVRLFPEEVDAIGTHADGLWGGAPDERVHRAMSRVQSNLGHDAVVSAVVGGGRGSADRQTLVPWGDRPIPRWSGDLPWPGSLPPPAPTTVYATPLPAEVVAADGEPVRVSGRGVVLGEPARFCPDGRHRLRPVAAWAGPWPVEERWWDESAERRLARFQIVGTGGDAWLLTVENGRWWTEARYD
ncbi:MAG: DNA polymerase Y family protein [Propionibacteriales bacterium]|nr:DNA polymerase Y family protein [Propionibacteriales bacterium]